MLYTSIVAERIGLRRSFVLMLAASFAINLMLALALMLQKPETRTIVVPPTLAAEREVWSFSDSGFYGKLEEALIVEADRIKKDHSSSVFYPDRARVNTKDLSVEVEGLQKTLVGSTVTSSKPKTWRLTFRYDAGRLFLTSLTDRPAAKP